MIKTSEPLSLVETKEIAGKIESEKAKQVLEHIKKFVKLKPEEAAKLKKELQELGLLKIKTSNILKTIDFLPLDAEDVRKIFIDTDLDQNEIAQILETVKKYA